MKKDAPPVFAYSDLRIRLIGGAAPFFRSFAQAPPASAVRSLSTITRSGFVLSARMKKGHPTNWCFQEFKDGSANWTNILHGVGLFRGINPSRMAAAYTTLAITAAACRRS